MLEQYDIRVAPITIQFGNETFEEGVDIDHDLFYRKIEELGIIPTSSHYTNTPMVCQVLPGANGAGTCDPGDHRHQHLDDFGAGVRERSAFRSAYFQITRE